MRNSFDFPIRINHEAGHFEDASGKPFLWHADTCWRIFWMMTYEEACEYLDNRADRGFTVIQVHMLPHHIHQANVYGELPFASPGEIDRMNPAYFANVDRVIRYAGEKGLTVAIAPMWLSTWEDDWHRYYHGQALTAYASFIAEHYGSFDNVIAFIHGGDDDSLPLHDEIRRIGALYKKLAPHSYNTFHAGIGAGWKFFGDDDWYDFCMNYTYSYPECLNQMIEAGRRYPTKPIILGETHYEYNQGITMETIRKYAYTSVLLGLSGQTYGNKDIWMASMFLQDGMWSPGAHHMAVLRDIFDEIPWYEMIPDLDGKLLRNIRTVMTYGNDIQIPAAASKDGKLVAAYVGDFRHFTCDFEGSFKGTFIDPVSGKKFPFSGRGGEAIHVPGYNADGGRDWVVILEYEK